MNRLSRTLICTGALAAVLPAVAVVAQTPPAIVDGVAAGEVTSTSAVVWARSDRAATMRALAAPAAGAGATIELTASSSADGHLAAQAVFTGLSPATRYRYEIWFEADGARGASETGTFRTAPAADASGAVSLI